MDQDNKPTEEPKPFESSTGSNFQSTGITQPAVPSQSTESLPSAESMPSFETEPSIEDTKSTVVLPKFKPIKKNIGKTILVIILIIVLIAAGAGAYLWRDKTANDSANKQSATISSLNAKIVSLQTELTVANANNGSQSLCVAVPPITTITDGIKSSITSGNAAALEAYMSSSVIIASASTGDVITSTQTQAVSSVTDFIAKATKPWNFSLSASVLTSFNSGSYGKYFPNSAIVGESTNKTIISFNFDCTSKIDSILLSTSEDLLE
jgi:hypothetical protein